MVEFKHGPNINYAKDGEAGGPRGGDKAKENKPGDYERMMGDRAGAYPIGGADIVELLLEAELGEGEKEQSTIELKSALRETLAYQEGLILGPEEQSYDLSDKASINLLQNMFLTVEGAMDRPQTPYLEPALDGAISRRIREAIRYASAPDKWRLKIGNKFKKINRTRKMSGIEELTDAEIGQYYIEPEQLQLERSTKALPILRELEAHTQARQIIDKAFLQRMATCEDPEGAGDMGKRFGLVITPDKTHWQSLFQYGEWGSKVNSVFWEIVELGLPDDKGKSLYAGGFEEKSQFKEWISKLITKADGDIDAVWTAWRLALMWEVPNEIGVSLEDGEQWSVAFPPIGNALMSWTSHLEEKRRIEFGLTKNGKVLKGRADRFVSHSGLPMSIDKFPPLCKSFLHETTIEYTAGDVRKEKNKEMFLKILGEIPQKPGADYFRNMHGTAAEYELTRMKELRKGIDDVLNRNGNGEVELSLWDIGYFGKLSFSSEIFPWEAAEKQAAEEEKGEIGSGSFGDWLLKRARSQSILDKSIKLRPPLNELADPDFFTSKVRNWVKVWGILATKDSKKDPYIEPEKNPRAWWVAGLIWYHRAGIGFSSRMTSGENSFRDYRTHSRQQDWDREKAGSTTTKKVPLGDILHHAEMCGFLRKEDSEWLNRSLNIKLRM